MGTIPKWMRARGALAVVAGFAAGVVFVVACGDGSDAGAQDGGPGAGPGGGPGAAPGGGPGGGQAPAAEGRFPGPCTVRDRLLVDRAEVADGYAAAEAVITYSYDVRGRVVRVESDGLVGEPHYHAAAGYPNNIPSPMGEVDGVADQVDEWEYDAAGNPTRMRRSLWMLRDEQGRYHLKTVGVSSASVPFTDSMPMVAIFERTFTYGCWP